MRFIRSLFSKKEPPILTNVDFWEWFQVHEKKFFRAVSSEDLPKIEKVFFTQLEPRLHQINDGIWFLTGMYDDHTAELILTADGATESIAFAEELAAAAPELKNWKITSLKHPSPLNHFGIEIAGIKMDVTNLSFYAHEHPDMPDEVDIVITHKELDESNRTEITQGVYLALDNSLGELTSITSIDNVRIIHPSEAEKELIPITKLRDYLIWREKEFVEKYQGVRRDTEHDTYMTFETTFPDGMPGVAIMNEDLLNWDRKASHPWMSRVKIAYEAEKNGMPGEQTAVLLDEIEVEIMSELKDSDGYLNVGRLTYDSKREVFFACVEFRKPSKVLHALKKKSSRSMTIDYE
ncbi:MAG: DUF695 domain-containing protein, partial [Bacteroidota bacterium]